ncbi:hypothetical protein [Cellulomonas soli]
MVGDLFAGRRRRLGQLLERRRTVGASWAERISHALPGVDQLTGELLLVEMAIAEQWPDDVEVWMREWVVADATRLHDPARPRDDCSICVALGAPTVAA